MLCKNFDFVIIYSNIASNTRFSSKATVSLSSWSRCWRSTENTYIGQALADVLHIYLQEVAKNWERSGARRELRSLRTLSPEWEEKQTAEAEHQDHNCIHGDPSAWHSCAQPAWSFYNTTCWINMSFFGTSLAGQSNNLYSLSLSLIDFVLLIEIKVICLLPLSFFTGYPFEFPIYHTDCCPHIANKKIKTHL